MSRNPVHFSVHPRYIPGSGASVSEAIARRVATEEKDSYETTLTGVYGPELQKEAETLGLRGIAESLQEVKGGWQVEDLITGERYWRGQIKASKAQAGDRVIAMATHEMQFASDDGAPFSKLTVKMVQTYGSVVSMFPEHGSLSQPRRCTFPRDALIKIERPERPL